MFVEFQFIVWYNPEYCNRGIRKNGIILHRDGECVLAISVQNYTLKFVSIYTHVIIGKPHSGWVDIIFQHFFQFIVTLVLAVQMIVISVISYIAFHINIEQIVDENIK